MKLSIDHARLDYRRSFHLFTMIPYDPVVIVSHMLPKVWVIADLNPTFSDRPVIILMIYFILHTERVSVKCHTHEWYLKEPI